MKSLHFSVLKIISSCLYMILQFKNSTSRYSELTHTIRIVSIPATDLTAVAGTIDQSVIHLFDEVAGRRVAVVVRISAVRKGREYYGGII